MVASVIVVVVLVTTDVLPVLIIVVRLFVVRLEASFSLVLALCTETGLGFPHFIELSVVLIVDVILENFILLVLEVLILQLLDHLLLFGPALAILQVVHVKLVFQVVDVGVLLDVGAVEAFKLGLEALVLLLELGLDILDALESLVSAF